MAVHIPRPLLWAAVINQLGSVEFGHVQRSYTNICHVNRLALSMLTQVQILKVAFVGLCWLDVSIIRYLQFHLSLSTSAGFVELQVFLLACAGVR